MGVGTYNVFKSISQQYHSYLTGTTGLNATYTYNGSTPFDSSTAFSGKGQCFNGTVEVADVNKRGSLNVRVGSVSEPQGPSKLAVTIENTGDTPIWVYFNSPQRTKIEPGATGVAEMDSAQTAVALWAGVMWNVSDGETVSFDVVKIEEVG